MDLVSQLISAFDPTRPHFRPTEIYNESWLVKIVLHQAVSIPDPDFPLGFLPGAVWFSEGLLPSLFIIGWEDPVSLLPIFGMTLILGSALGYTYGKFTR